MFYIYQFRNKINNKSYIGYTSKYWEVRCKEHIGASARGSQSLLCKAIRKWGLDVFDIRPISSAPTIELAKLFERRTVYTLCSFGPRGYNMTKGGDGSAPHTKEHKEYMSKIMKNRVISSETRLKMSLAAKGKPKNPEDVKRRAETQKKDPNLKIRNKIAGLYSHYKRGFKVSEENMKLIQHLIERAS